MTRFRSYLSGIVTIIFISIVILFLTTYIGTSLYYPSRFVSSPSYCTLTIINGTVEVQRTDTIAWQEAEDGMTLGPGSRVRTTSQSHALLTFYKGTTTKLEPDTDMVVSKLEVEQDNQADVVVLTQRSGVAWNQITKSSDSDCHFEIQTESASAIAHGTSFLTEVDESGRMLIQTTEGQVNVVAQGQQVNVSPGQQTEVNLGLPPLLPAPIPPHRNELVITASSSSIISIVDPTGSHTGYLHDGSVLNQITGSKLLLSEKLQHMVRIPGLKSGIYTVKLYSAEEGISHFKIDALVEGQNAFQYDVSCNITKTEDYILNLHLEVLDGLIQGFSVINAQSLTDNTVEVETSVNNITLSEETAPSGAVNNTESSDKPDTWYFDLDRIRTILGKEDPYYEWVVLFFLFFVGIFLAVILKMK